MSPLVGCPGPGGFLSGGAFARGTFSPGVFCSGALLAGGFLSGAAFVRGAHAIARSPQVQCVYAPSRLSVPIWRDGQTKKNKKADKLGLVAPRGVDPHSPNFQGM